MHGIDTMGWVMGDKLPIRCWGVGGRQSRTDPKYGNIYDHFSVVYEYPNNVRGYHHCRHWVKTDPGSRTTSWVPRAWPTSSAMRSPARTSGAIAVPRTNMYQVEHDEMFAAIRAGKPINNGEAAAHSTLAGPDGPHGRLHRAGRSRRK